MNWCLQISAWFVLLVPSIPSYGRTTVSSITDGHLSCVQFLAIANYVAMNILVHVFGGHVHSFPLRAQPGVEMKCWRAHASFRRMPTQFPRVAYPFPLSPAMASDFFFFFQHQPLLFSAINRKSLWCRVRPQGPWGPLMNSNGICLPVGINHPPQPELASTSNEETHEPSTDDWCFAWQVVGSPWIITAPPPACSYLKLPNTQSQNKHLWPCHPPGVL